jgi:hypothetical protein
MKRNPRNVRFSELRAVCGHFFGPPRQPGTSHCVYRTPWIGDPRINIQEEDGKARADQVKQVLNAIEKLEEKDEQNK